MPCSAAVSTGVDLTGLEIHRLDLLKLLFFADSTAGLQCLCAGRSWVCTNLKLISLMASTRLFSDRVAVGCRAQELMRTGPMTLGAVGIRLQMPASAGSEISTAWGLCLELDWQTGQQIAGYSDAAVALLNRLGRWAERHADSRSGADLLSALQERPPARERDAYECSAS
jgi:hypothetical protein